MTRRSPVFDPLSPFTALLPLMVVTALMPTPQAPLLVLAVGTSLLLVADLRRGGLAALAVLTVALLIGSSLALSAPVERVGASETVLALGGLELQRNQVLAGARLGGKLGSVMSLCVLTGLLSRPEDLLRALTTHLHVPYRVAYAGVAAISFRQRLAAEYRSVKEAHALRGTRAPLPVLRPLVRAWAAVPALTAGAVRHAERVAASMDARGFGAYSTRTERHRPRWRRRDTVLVLAGWALAAWLAATFSGGGLVLHDV
ncbi:Putative HMP/thiamine permease protein YkoC [Actinomyces bovis]|uniref:HMP/thiamine permease protein YkoC n=1 Tax=Actinomyces bovis TaxID=1658 RepID=A0ABY1VN22_9ACTO|nr:energy-coupling factor transporter transmembrane component T [Actinomyces bovis]SPT53390.1 Putative HMP/thiamine permease protein YkoC [Actinomyces bovis]VEG52797.1 Putative HMP/thiamine permease protein YkoC [Actinomyces israelii]